MIMQVLFSTKIEELPRDFHVAVEVDSYEVMVVSEKQLSITVSKKRGPGRGSHVVIYNPDPKLTVEEVYKKAQELLEALVRKE
jgi:hypothetical protein